jgi:hypothetical protein
MPRVTAWFENYCDRGLARRSIVEEEIFFNSMSKLYLWAFPIVSVSLVDIDGTEYAGDSFLINRQAGYIYGKNGDPWLRGAGDLIKVTYVGGYEHTLVPPDTFGVPADLAAVYADACGGETGVSGAGSGTGGGGGGTIKSIGLGSGALSVAFDTSSAAQKGGITGAFSIEGVPTEVQNYASTLNYYVRQRV